MTDNESPELQGASLQEAMQAYHEVKSSFPAKGVVPGRAETDEEKRAIIERLYALWCQSPQLRLGQLLLNCAEDDLYSIEDGKLIDRLEVWSFRIPASALPAMTEYAGMFDRKGVEHESD